MLFKKVYYVSVGALRVEKIIKMQIKLVKTHKNASAIIFAPPSIYKEPEPDSTHVDIHFSINSYFIN